MTPLLLPIAQNGLFLCIYFSELGVNDTLYSFTTPCHYSKGECKNDFIQSLSNFLYIFINLLQMNFNTEAATNLKAFHEELNPDDTWDMSVDTLLKVVKGSASSSIPCTCGLLAGLCCHHCHGP